MKAANRSVMFLIATWALSQVVLPATALRAAEPDGYVKRTTWQQTMLASRAQLAAESRTPDRETEHRQVQLAHAQPAVARSRHGRR